MIGVIGGTIFFENMLIEAPDKKEIDTPYGFVNVYTKGDIAFIPRHGINNNIPPHKVNHKANVFALKSAGATKIIGACSSGCLKKEIDIPAIAVPDDYMDLKNTHTFFDDKIIHTTPELSEPLRKAIIKAAESLGFKTVNKGAYLETRGPRLETKAEINLFKNFADFIGMTGASEATLAKELKVGYAMILSLDNYGNGLAEEELNFEQIKQRARNNSENIKNIILKTIELIK